MRTHTAPHYGNLPILSVSESFSNLTTFLEEQFRARLAANPSLSLDEYGILTRVEDGSDKDVIFGKNEIVQVDEEFYATINTVSLKNDKPWAFVGEDWFRACWMIRGGVAQDLIPNGTVRVPSWVTPSTLTIRPGYVDFELQPDSYVKVERLQANGPMMWVSIALSRRALQRALGEMDSTIPCDLDHYIYRENSLLLLRRSPISSAGMKILLSLFDAPLTGKLRVKFLRSQILSLLYVALGSEWDNENPHGPPSADYKKIVEGAEMLRIAAKSSQFNIAEIARQLGMSRSYFDKSFRLIYGTTPAKYLLDEKMKYAAELIIKGDMPIKEIADHLGYGTHSTLTRAFHKWYGTNPLKYRQGHISREFPSRH